MTQTNDIVDRLENRAKLLDDEGLYVESNMNAEAAETIRVLRNEVQRLEQLTGVYERNNPRWRENKLLDEYYSSGGTSNTGAGTYKVTRFTV